MFRPSGSLPITITSAPASEKTSGETPAAAPFAQSSTTFSPSRRCGSVSMRCTTYRSSASANRRMRPTPAPVGASGGRCIALSIRSSTSSGSFVPPDAKILIPLSGAGLCDAEIITPKSAPMSATRNAAAGVGMTPASYTSTPEAASPAATAAAMNSPEIRGSRATTARGRLPAARGPSPSTWAAACASDRASSGVTSRFARPRTPSVPKRRAIPGDVGTPGVSASRTAAPCGPS